MKSPILYEMDGSVFQLPLEKAGRKRARTRQSKNWLHVNIGQREAKAMRALCECYGIQFRVFLESAIRAKARAVSEMLAVKAWDAAKMSREDRREMGRRIRERTAALGWCNAARN